MAKVVVKLDALGVVWTSACTHAVTDLNAIFKRKSIGVVLALSGKDAPVITVQLDPTIGETIVHGRTSATTDDAGRLVSAVVKLPGKAIISTPAGIRGAGGGVLKVIAAHEFVHALGQEEHNTHLMAKSFTKDSGAQPAGDKLVAGSVSLPPIVLATESIDLLKSIWS
jgi:hypothetical protein